jgi:hypothetical protein
MNKLPTLALTDDDLVEFQLIYQSGIDSFPQPMAWLSLSFPQNNCLTEHGVRVKIH